MTSISIHHYVTSKCDEALRIRIKEDGARLTYKGPKLDRETKSRKELTVKIDDPLEMEPILSALVLSYPQKSANAGPSILLAMSLSLWMRWRVWAPSWSWKPWAMMRNWAFRRRKCSPSCQTWPGRIDSQLLSGAAGGETARNLVPG